MSHLALQHVVVRMLYDTGFAQRVYDDVGAATASCDLAAGEREWLCAGDPRAYAVDPLRRARSLGGLVEEYPVSCARLVRELGIETAKSRLDTYFSSEIFHEDIQARAALAPSFGKWLGSGSALELAICRARRAREREGNARSEAIDSLHRAHIRTAPGIETLVAPAGTVRDFGACLGLLRAHPAGLHDAILDSSLELEPPQPSRELEGILVLGHQGELALEAASVEIAKILGACRDEISIDDLVDHAATLGADAEDVEGLVRSFATDGILLVRP